VKDLKAQLATSDWEDAADVQYLLTEIEKSSEELARVPNELRRASSRQAVDLVLLLNNLRNRLLLVAPDVTVRVTSDVAELTVYGVRGELQALFLDILYNAVDAMKGEGEIRVTVSRRDGMASIAIQDNGPGVDVSIRDGLFKAGISTKGEDHGYGLARADQICRELGGSVALVPSSLGARFLVELPITDGSD
jgi:signal transduction histidine kinase